ncbi:MAG: hypothetical protein H0W68_10345 [Gemmatimonadaceae bacterium]|nr:hypothetical protein [Gemmatimonadaceae bacterium]
MPRGPQLQSLVLTDSEIAQLTAWSRRPQTARELAERARITLASATSAPNLRRFLAAAAAIVALGACNAPTVCTQQGNLPSVELSVRDERTNSSIKAAEVQVLIDGQTNPFIKQFYRTDSTVVLIYGPPGAYDVSIAKAGYAPATRRVTVTEVGMCRRIVATVVTALLTPLP